MSDEISIDTPPAGLTAQWASSDLPMDYGHYLFKPAEFDIYVNKVTYEAFVFHGKAINAAAIDYAEYDGHAFSLTVVYKDGRRLDIGTKIEWVVRAYLSHADEIHFTRTKDGEVVDGVVVPLVHAGDEA